MHDSKNPSSNLTAMSEPKVVETAVQDTTAPQQNTLTASTLDRGRRWRR